MLCPTTPCTGYSCPNILDMPLIKSLEEGGGFDTCSVTVQYMETIAVFKMNSEVIKCPTIGAASFNQSLCIARHLPIRKGALLASVPSPPPPF